MDTKGGSRSELAAVRATEAGRVVEPLPNAMFQVELKDGRRVRCHLATQLRRTVVRVLPGDRVEVELSSRDTTRGRITYRAK